MISVAQTRILSKRGVVIAYSNRDDEPGWRRRRFRVPLAARHISELKLENNVSLTSASSFTELLYVV